MSKKSSKQHKQANGSVKGGTLRGGSIKSPTHRTNGYQSRRNTLHPRARDSVLSTESSDHSSSSMSDDTILSPPANDFTQSILYTKDMDHLIRQDVLCFVVFFLLFFVVFSPSVFGTAIQGLHTNCVISVLYQQSQWETKVFKT